MVKDNSEIFATLRVPRLDSDIGYLSELNSRDIARLFGAMVDGLLQQGIDHSTIRDAMTWWACTDDAWSLPVEGKDEVSDFAKDVAEHLRHADREKNLSHLEVKEMNDKRSVVTCNSCPRWERIEGDTGKCRAHPPDSSLVPVPGKPDQRSFVSCWPMTRDLDWCAEHPALTESNRILPVSHIKQ